MTTLRAIVSTLLIAVPLTLDAQNSVGDWTFARITDGESISGAAFSDDDCMVLSGGAGGTLQGDGDRVLYLHQNVSGNVAIQAQMTRAGGAGARIGVMIRESLEPDSRHLFSHLGGLSFLEHQVWSRPGGSHGRKRDSDADSTGHLGLCRESR